MSFRKFWDHKVVHWIVVLVIFACTGFTLKYLIQWMCVWMGIEKYSVLYWISWIFPGLVIYQYVLLGYAWLFGKYAYFKARKQKMWKRIKGWFGGKKDEEAEHETIEGET